MSRRKHPLWRFVIEAAFIILVGVVAALLELEPLAIVLAMGVAWVVVVIVELVVKRRSSARRRAPAAGSDMQMRAPVPAEQVEREPESEPAPEPRRRKRLVEPRSSRVATDLGPRQWNLWELERRAREHAGADAVPDEWAAIFRSLREFAKSDGELPPQFDSLVRESFPELTRTAT